MNYNVHVNVLKSPTKEGNMKVKIGKRFDGRPVELVPHEVIPVDSLPKCNFCEKTAEFDFKTNVGPWANGCEQHWRMYRGHRELGIGKGQLWVDRKTVEEVIRVG